MHTYKMLAAHAAVKAALLQLLEAAAEDGKYMGAATAHVTVEDGDANGEWAVGGIARGEFHALTGGSL